MIMMMMILLYPLVHLVEVRYLATIPIPKFRRLHSAISSSRDIVHLLYIFAL